MAWRRCAAAARWPKSATGAAAIGSPVEGSRGGRLESRLHAVLRQLSHLSTGYPIHHFRGRELDPVTVEPVQFRPAFPPTAAASQAFFCPFARAGNTM